MKILAFDTALFGCSVGVYDSAAGECVAEREVMARGQAELLVPMVQEVLQKADVEFADVDLIAVTVGRGAFTGLRIGLSAAQGFGLALGKPVAGLVTTEILAAAFFEKEKLEKGRLLGVLIETKRQDFYCQFFNADGSAHTEPMALSGDEIADMGGDAVYIGDALERFGRGERRQGYELPDPCVMARMALRAFEAGDIMPPEPLYLRDADVSSPKKAQRVILED